MQVELPEVGASERLVLVNAFDDAGHALRAARRRAWPAGADGGADRARAPADRLPDAAERLVAHRLRLEGYRRALAAAGIAFDPDLVIDADRDGGPEERARADQTAIERLLAIAGAADRALLRQRPAGGDGLRHAAGARHRGARGDVGGGLRRLPGDLGDALPAAHHDGAALRPDGRGGGAADAGRPARRTSR